MKKNLLLVLIFLVSHFSFDLYAQNDNSFLRNKLLIDVSYKRNLSPFSEVWPNAFGGYISYGFAFPDHYLLTLRTGYFDNIVKSELKDSSTFKNASSVVIPFHIGGRYYFTDNELMPYFTFINGLNIVFENTSLGGKKEKRTLVKYAWTVGFGLTYNVSGNVNLDLAAHYNSHFYTTNSMMTALEYTLGVGIGM